MPESQKVHEPELELTDKWLEFRDWLSDKWSWAKENPWKAALLALPFLVFVVLSLVPMFLRGRYVDRRIDMRRADVEKKDRSLAEELNLDVQALERRRSVRVEQAEAGAEIDRSEAEGRVLSEREHYAQDPEALINALRDDAKRDRQ